MAQENKENVKLEEENKKNLDKKILEEKYAAYKENKLIVEEHELMED